MSAEGLESLRAHSFQVFQVGVKHYYRYLWPNAYTLLMMTEKLVLSEKDLSDCKMSWETESTNHPVMMLLLSTGYEESFRD